MSDEFERYAVYWVPKPPDALARFGFHWTGWCADQGDYRAHRGVGGVSVDAASITTRSWRHGLHGVLKAPFRLGSGHSRFTLEHELSRLGEEIVALKLPRLKLAVIRGRVCVVTREKSPDLGAAVAKVCKTLAPLDADHRGRAGFGFNETMAEPASRTPDTAQASQLVQFPAAEAHRFLMPLTDALDLGMAYQVMERLRPILDPLLDERRWLYDLALMGDPGEGRPLRVLQRYELRETPLRPEARAIPCQGRMVLAPALRVRAAETDVAI